MEISKTVEIIDANNAYITIAHSLVADQRSAHAAYSVDLFRRVVIDQLNPHVAAMKHVVLAVDNGTWRRGPFPQYKASRDAEKGKSTLNYDLFSPVLQAIIDELKEHSPINVVQVPGVEGDDVIAVITAIAQYSDSTVTIHSNDHDFMQLQEKFAKVKQISPLTHKYLKPTDKNYSLLDHIIRGDSGDGVPNMLSEDNCFVAKIRQTVMTAPRYASLLDRLRSGKPEDVLNADELRRYKRNKQMVDMSEIPDDVVTKIITAYEAQLNKARVPGAYTKYLASHHIL